MDRRPSFSAFAAARSRRDSTGSAGGWAGPSSRGMARRTSSSSEISNSNHNARRDSYLAPPTRPRSRSNSNSSAYPNFPFPFPGDQRSKLSLLNSMNGAFDARGSSAMMKRRDSSTSMRRRDSNISIRYSEDGDGWDDQPDLDGGILSRRSSYDSSFAFDHGRKSSFTYSPAMSRKPSSEGYTFGVLPPPRPSSASSFYRRTSSQVSLRDLARPPSRSYGMESRSSSGGAGGLNFMGRSDSWQSQMGLMISGGRAMERRISVESLGEMERIRRLGGMRELNRRESEVLERRASYAYSDAGNPWGVEMNDSAVSPVFALFASNVFTKLTLLSAPQFAHLQSHWSPSTMEDSPALRHELTDEASSPELAESTDSGSDSPPTSPISNLADLRSRYLEPIGTYETRQQKASLPSVPSVLAPLPTHTPMSIHFPFGDAHSVSKKASSHSRNPSTQSQIEQQQHMVSPGELIASMLADQARSEGDFTDSDTDSEMEHDAEITIGRRHALSLSPVHFHAGSEFPLNVPTTAQPERPAAYTHSSGSSDLGYLAQSIQITSESLENVPSTKLSPLLPPRMSSHLVTAPPPGLLPPLPIQRALRSAKSMSALRQQPEHGARKYDRLAAFETQDRSLDFTSPFTPLSPTSPSRVKTSYFDPSTSSTSAELQSMDVTPRPIRRRPGFAPAVTRSASATTVPTDSSPSNVTPWEYPRTSYTRPILRTAISETTTPPRQQVVSSSALPPLGPPAPTPTASASTRKPVPPPLPLPHISPPPIRVPLNPKRSAISLPFERAFVQRAKEEQRAAARAGSFAGTSSTSYSNHTHSSSYEFCTGTAIHPESGLCYCGAPYLTNSRRMSKPNPRLVAPHLPPPHLRATPAAKLADQVQAVHFQETQEVVQEETEVSRLRFSMPATKADPVVLPRIPTRAVPLPEHQPGYEPKRSDSSGGKAKKVLTRLFAGHRKTASSGTF